MSQCDNSKNIIYQNEILKKQNEELKIKVQKLEEIVKEVESGSAQHIITKQELQACEEELEDEIQKTKNLQTQNSKSLKSLEKSRLSSAANQKLAQECQEQLKNEIEEKEILQEKYESVCPSWSEWSSCSQTCWGIKTRTDKFSNSDEQIKECNQFSPCPRSGK